MKSIIVIGAGPAGLTAAYDLLVKNSDVDVIVLEETQELGGISRTVCHNGNRMDIGGHRFFSKDQQIMDWWKKMLPLQGAPAKDDRILHRERALAPGGPDPEREDRVMLLRDRVSRIYFAKRFFDYPLSLKMATFLNMGLWRTMRAGFSYLWSCMFKREEKSLEDFYINRFGHELYAMFFESYTTKVWGRHPSQLAADWGAQRVRGLSVFKLLLDSLKKALGQKDSGKAETSLIEEFWYPKFGPGQLWEQVAADVASMGGRILKGYKASRIVCEAGNVTAVVCDTAEGQQVFEADTVISSMPLKDLMQAMSSVDVPQNVAQIAAGLPYRDFITVGLLVQRFKLKNTTRMKTLGNIVPDCWIYVQEPEVQVGRLQIFNNWSPYLVKDPENTVWVGMEYFCSEGDDFWRLSEQELTRRAIDEMVAMNIISRDDVLDTHCEKVKKAYPAYFDTYEDIETLRRWLTGVGGLYCVGRNGQHRYNNMDHSMLTSFFCVDHILGNNASKHDIWKINAESEYHEAKQEK
ncbi:MAG: NAD(P)/FAD-dependent oxidoreductase [Desulfovibrio sp.]|nr:NAD(P)/FAD-dependent oxidoreductase [Desulfovibrio sp.]